MGHPCPEFHEDREERSLETSCRRHSTCAAPAAAVLHQSPAAVLGLSVGKVEPYLVMASEEGAVKKSQTVEARARNINHNVRCTECGSQSIEDSQADIAILLRKLIREEIRAGKTDKEVYEKLEDDFGETVLYAPRFDLQTAGLWLSPFIVAGAAAGVWAYQSYRQKTNVHTMALNLVRGVPLTLKEKQAMIDILTPPRKRWSWRD